MIGVFEVLFIPVPLRVVLPVLLPRVAQVAGVDPKHIGDRASASRPALVFISLSRPVARDRISEGGAIEHHFSIVGGGRGARVANRS